MSSTEVVARYEHDGRTYEIDHLGIARDNQYGEFAVFCRDVQVADFTTAAAGYLPEHRPQLPDTDTLIGLAKQAVADADTVTTTDEDLAACRCVQSCADDPTTVCSLSGQPHVHPDDGTGVFGPCPTHPDAPGDQ